MEAPVSYGKGNDARLLTVDRSVDPIITGQFGSNDDIDHTRRTHDRVTLRGEVDDNLTRRTQGYITLQEIDEQEEVESLTLTNKLFKILKDTKDKIFSVWDTNEELIDFSQNLANVYLKEKLQANCQDILIDFKYNPMQALNAWMNREDKMETWQCNMPNIIKNTVFTEDDSDEKKELVRVAKRFATQIFQTWSDNEWYCAAEMLFLYNYQWYRMGQLTNWYTGIKEAQMYTVHYKGDTFFIRKTIVQKMALDDRFSLEKNTDINLDLIPDGADVLHVMQTFNHKKDKEVVQKMYTPSGKKSCLVKGKPKKIKSLTKNVHTNWSDRNNLPKNSMRRKIVITMSNSVKRNNPPPQHLYTDNFKETPYDDLPLVGKLYNIRAYLQGDMTNKFRTSDIKWFYKVADRMLYERPQAQFFGSMVESMVQKRAYDIFQRYIHPLLTLASAVRLCANGDFVLATALLGAEAVILIKIFDIHAQNQDETWKDLFLRFLPTGAMVKDEHIRKFSKYLAVFHYGTLSMEKLAKYGKFVAKVLYYAVTGVPYYSRAEEFIMKHQIWADKAAKVVGYHNHLMKNGCPISHDRDFMDMANALHKEKVELQSTIVKDFEIRTNHFIPNFVKLFKDIDDIVDKINRSEVSSQERVEPVAFILVGKAGIGKTIIAKTLLKSLAVRYKRLKGHNLPNTLADIEKLVYTPVTTSQYWEGYDNQPSVFVDEVFQVKDMQTETDTYKTILSCINAAPFPLDMADVNAKGTKFYTSSFFGMTANVIPPIHKGVEDASAIERRLLCFKVVCENPIPTEALLQFQNGLPDHKFYLIDFRHGADTDYLDRKMYTYTEVVDMLFDDYVNKLKFNQSSGLLTADLLELIDKPNEQVRSFIDFCREAQNLTSWWQWLKRKIYPMTWIERRKYIHNWLAGKHDPTAPYANCDFEDLRHNPTLRDQIYYRLKYPLLEEWVPFIAGFSVLFTGVAIYRMLQQWIGKVDGRAESVTHDKLPMAKKVIVQGASRPPEPQISVNPAVTQHWDSLRAQYSCVGFRFEYKEAVTIWQTWGLFIKNRDFVCVLHSMLCEQIGKFLGIIIDGVAYDSSILRFKKYIHKDLLFCRINNNQMPRRPDISKRFMTAKDIDMGAWKPSRNCWFL